MTSDQAPGTAVQVVAAALDDYWMECPDQVPHAAVAALARGGWLTPPDRVAALEAVAAAAGTWRDWLVGMPFAGPEHDLRAALAALDAAQAGTTPRTYDQLTEQEGDPPNERIIGPWCP